MVMDQPAAQNETVGQNRARQNYDCNLSVLELLRRQESNLLPHAFSHTLDLEWVFGKDGFLTAMDSAGQWIAGCSFPKRAAMAMLKKLHLPGPVGCYLAPTHAGQIVAALEILSREQGIVVIVPELADLAFMLCCCDFSQDISDRRLFFVTSENWPQMLVQLFEQTPGLSTPSQFIRTPFTADEVVDLLIPQAEYAFKQINASRDTNVVQLKAGYRKIDADQKLLLVASSHFRLWEDEGHCLVQAVVPHETQSVTTPTALWHINPDNPADSSGYNLALAAAECGALVIPNRYRAQLPDVIADDVPVISWITQGHIGQYDSRYPQDGLILADENWAQIAITQGWPKERIRQGTWPVEDIFETANGDIRPSVHPQNLGLIANMFLLDTPKSQLELSSHHVLWELIRHDIALDPFAIGSNINEFINRRMKKIGISEEGFDRAFFIDRLIVPAWQQAIVRLLIDAKIPLRIFGQNWDRLDGMAQHWHGLIQTRDEFQTAKSSVSVLINPSIIRADHPVLHQGLPVIDAFVNQPSQWISRARSALNPGQHPTAARIPPVSLSTIHELLR